MFLLYPRILGNKLTQKENVDSGVQFITQEGPRQIPLLAKDPDQVLWKSYIPYVYMPKPKFPETSLNKGKERYNQS